MVAARILRHVLEVPWPGQRLQHLDGGNDVVIDGVALGLVQGAGSDGEVLHLLGRKEACLHPLRVAPVPHGGDVTYALLVLGAHGLGAGITAAQKLAVFFQCVDFVLQGLQLLPLGTRIHHRAQRQLAAQCGQLGIALQDFKPRVHQPNAVVQGLQLGGLVHHVHGRGDLAAVVQQAGHLEFVAVPVTHAKARQRPLVGGIHRLGQHHGEGGHTLAMATGVGRLFVNGQVDQVHERLEQALQLRDEQAVGEGNGSLRGQRLGQALVGLGERGDLAGLPVPRVDELQHADQFVVVVLHRHGQKRLRAVPRARIETAGA
ncbi:hypothetical protein D3C71_1273790 [compost metagenome]